MQPYIKIQISSYALFASIGLFCMMLVIYIRNQRLLFKEYLSFVGFMVLAAVIGSKFLFIMTQMPDIIAHFSVKYMLHKVITSGFVFYGGLFGAILGCILFSHLKALDVKDMLNLAAPGYSIFHAFGRIGCFFAGCCYGKISTWGFPLQNQPDIMRIPVQLIESFILFVLSGCLISSEKRGKNDLFKIYIICYAICRFLLEFLRGDTIRGSCFFLSTSQWISLLILLVFCLYKILKKCLKI